MCIIICYHLVIIVIFQLWVTGGETEEISTEVVNLATTRQGHELPWKFSYHCIAKMDNSDYTKVIIIGGKNYPERTAIGATRPNGGPYWVAGPNLWQNGGRVAHSCAHIKHNNGSNYVIVAGGHSFQDIHSTSEILNTDDCDLYDCFRGWYPGKDFL